VLIPIFKLKTKTEITHPLKNSCLEIHIINWASCL